MWNVRPTGGRVLIQIIEAPTVTAGGIVIPEQAATRPISATIVAVPNDWWGDVEVGETILFNSYTGVPIPDGSNRALVRYDDIIAVVSGADLADPAAWDPAMEETL